jgi:hypothetical protein
MSALALRDQGAERRRLAGRWRHMRLQSPAHGGIVAFVLAGLSPVAAAAQPSATKATGVPLVTGTRILRFPAHHSRRSAPQWEVTDGPSPFPVGSMERRNCGREVQND